MKLLLTTWKSVLPLAAVGALLVAGMTAVTSQTGSAEEITPVAINSPAPELVGGPWLNTPKNTPIKLASRKGKVTIVEFWTFG